ncbi:MAG TPA: hypothetical protein VFQ85_03275 [Mycobacteriales bacterium]|jgi:hypothetical protein|nr:hypothetical protein [Mycobacteriales bacterium]
MGRARDTATVATVVAAVGMLLAASRGLAPATDRSAPRATKVGDCDAEWRVKSANPLFPMAEGCSTVTVLRRARAVRAGYTLSESPTTALTTDASGRPVALMESQLGLVLVRCQVVTCTTATETLVAATGTFAEAQPSLAVGPDGSIAIGLALTQPEDDPVRVVLCPPGCTAPQPIVRYVGGGVPSVMYDGTGHLVVLRNGYGGDALLRCLDATCTSQVSIDVGHAAQAGEVTMAGGAPVAAFTSWTATGLAVVIVRCGDSACMSPATFVPYPEITQTPSTIAVRGRDDGSLFLSWVTPRQGVRVDRCVGTSCAPVAATDDGSAAVESPVAGSEGASIQAAPSMILDGSGVPTIAYRFAGAARVLRCGSTTCANWMAVAADGVGRVRAGVSIAIGPNAKPVLAYVAEGRDADAPEFRLALCGNLACT